MRSPPRMSSSLWYSAVRARALVDAERAKIREIAAAVSVRVQIDAYIHSGYGWSGEDFQLVEGSGDELFHGSIQLPTESLSMAVGDPDAEFWNGVLHWCEAVTRLRRTIAGATWTVNVDGTDIPWDEDKHAFVAPAPASARARRARRAEWERAVVGAGRDRFRTYAPGATFGLGDLVSDRTFGRGVALGRPGPDRIEILFREGARVLPHAVPGAPTEPEPPEELDLDRFPSGDDPF